MYITRNATALVVIHQIIRSDLQVIEINIRCPTFFAVNYVREGNAEKKFFEIPDMNRIN